MLDDLKAGTAAGGGLILGAVVGAACTILYAQIWMLPAARDDGRAAEKAIWTEREAKAKAAADAALDAAQDEIDEVERQALDRDAARLRQVEALNSALETALTQEDADASIPTPSGRPVACRPAVPRSVRDALDAIGRAPAPRAPAGKPDAAVH